MGQVAPLSALMQLIAPYYPEGRTGRPPFSLNTMLGMYFIQQWFTLFDFAMQEAFFDTPLYKEFAQLEEFPLLRFRYWLEKHQLTEQILTVVNQLLI